MKSTTSGTSSLSKRPITAAGMYGRYAIGVYPSVPANGAKIAGCPNHHQCDRQPLGTTPSLARSGRAFPLLSRTIPPHRRKNGGYHTAPVQRKFLGGPLPRREGEAPRVSRSRCAENEISRPVLAGAGQRR